MSKEFKSNNPEDLGKMLEAKAAAEKSAKENNIEEIAKDVEAIKEDVKEYEKVAETASGEDKKDAVKSAKSAKKQFKRISDYAVEKYGFTEGDEVYSRKYKYIDKDGNKKSGVKEYVVAKSVDGTKQHFQKTVDGEYFLAKTEEKNGGKKVTTHFNQGNISSQVENGKKIKGIQAEVMASNNFDAFYQTKKEVSDISNNSEKSSFNTSEDNINKIPQTPEEIKKALDQATKKADETEAKLAELTSKKDVKSSSLDEVDTEIVKNYNNLSKEELWDKFSKNRSEDMISFNSQEEKDIFIAWQKKDQQENPEKYTIYNESKSHTPETKEGSIRSNKHLDILESRRQNLIEREEEVRKIEALMEKVDEGKYDFLSQKEQLEVDKLLKQVKTESKKQHFTNEAMMIRERISTLDHRISNTERQISQYNNRNENWFNKNVTAKLALSKKQLGRWWKNPDNKKKLVRRVAVSAVVATASGLFLPVGVAGALGAGAVRMGISYAGGEGARTWYNKWLRKKGKDGQSKDYRQKMANLRAERGDVSSDKSWEHYKESIDGLDHKIVKRQNKKRMYADTAGRVLAGFGTRGLMDGIGALIDDVPNNVSPGTIDPVIPNPIEPVVPEKIESFISKDAYINKGEGITHALKRQLENNPEIAKKLGIEGKPTGNDLARVAKQFGYIKEDGSDIRVFMGKGAAYELTLDENGNPMVREHIGGHIEGNNYVDGNFQERHIGGQSPFEGGTHEGRGMGTGEYEYIKDGASRNKGISINPDNNGIKINPNDLDRKGISINPDNPKILRNWPGHRFVVNNMFDAKFGNMHSDRSVMELFNANGVRFNQDNFEMLGYRLAKDPNGADIFVNINSDNPEKLLSWQDIYEQTNFNELKQKYPNLDLLEQRKGINLDDAVNKKGLNLDDVVKNENTPGPKVREAFTQKTGHFEIVHDENGNIGIRHDENFQFKGDTQTGDFTGREQRLLEKGKFEPFAGMPPQGRIPELGLNNAGIIKLKNGQYVFQNIIASPDAASGLNYGTQQMKKAMDILGMPNQVEHAITDKEVIPRTNMYRTRVFTPISEEQAKYIGKIYSEMRRFTGMNNPNQ